MFRRVEKMMSHLRNTTLLLLVVTVVLAGQSTGFGVQERRPPKQYQPPVQPHYEPVPTNVIISPDEDYRIGPSDIVEVKIQDAPELSGIFRVSTAGTIVLPFLGDVTVQNKTTEELASQVADGLRGNYLLSPQVAVTVKQINSRSYFIQGAVRRPGMYQIEGRPSLIKLITVAGGLTDDFGSTAFIIREIKSSGTIATASVRSEDEESEVKIADPPAAADKETPPSNIEDTAQYELVKSNINSLLKGNFDQNVQIEPGDIVHIPPGDVFFVAGEVNAPGSFPLKEGTTLRQAISLAQGTNFKAAANRGVIFREDPASGKRQEIVVNISAVMTGKKEDVAIMSNDIIIVPNSRMKSVTSVLLSAFGQNAPRILYRY